MPYIHTVDDRRRFHELVECNMNERINPDEFWCDRCDDDEWWGRGDKPPKHRHGCTNENTFLARVSTYDLKEYHKDLIWLAKAHQDEPDLHSQDYAFTCASAASTIKMELTKRELDHG